MKFKFNCLLGLTFSTFTASTLYASADLRCRKWWS